MEMLLFIGLFGLYILTVGYHVEKGEWIWQRKEIQNASVPGAWGRPRNGFCSGWPRSEKGGNQNAVQVSQAAELSPVEASTNLQTLGTALRKENRKEEKEMIFYRYWDHPTEDGVRVRLETLTLVKETPCGYWIDHKQLPDRKPRWVSKTSHKRYAWPTRREALLSFVARKKQQVRYMKMKHEQALAAYSKGLDMLEEMERDDDLK